MNINMRDSLVGCVASSPQLYRCLVVAMLTSVLLIGCQYSCSNSAYTTAREVLDAEVDNLPLPPGSEILDRYDGISMGRVEACRGVYTELLIGNSLPEADIYQFYKDQFTARGWQITLESTEVPGVVIEKDGRCGVEISDNYHVSSGISRDTIRKAEHRFTSLVYVNIGYGIYDAQVCQDAVDAIDKSN